MSSQDRFQSSERFINTGPSLVARLENLVAYNLLLTVPRVTRNVTFFHQAGSGDIPTIIE